MAVAMDKQTFLNLAPEYYLLALCMHFEYPREYYSDATWREAFTYQDEDGAGEYCYVENTALRTEAVRLLFQQEAISVIEDPFGPTIWQKTPNLSSLIESLEGSPASVFFKATASGNPKSWLIAALQKVNVTADDLGIARADFEKEPPDIWEPIKLDPTDPLVVEAVTKLSEVTEAIEHDNGYSAEHAQERDAVVADLRGGLDKLKSGEVSIGWIQRTVNALKTASVTFANTVKAQTIDGAMQALKEVVKTHMKQAIEALLHLWPW